MSQEIPSSAVPTGPQSIPVYRKIDGQEQWINLVDNLDINDKNQREFSVGTCKVTPLSIETYTEPNRVGCLRVIVRWGLNEVLWEGLTSQTTSQIIPGTSTEVRLADGAPKRSAVLLTHAKTGQKLEEKDIPDCLRPFVHGPDGKYYGENIPAGLLAQLQEDTENLAGGVPQFHFSTDDQMNNYPRGGRSGFINDVSPLLQRRGTELTRIFGTFLERDITVRWVPGLLAVMDGVAAVASSVNAEFDDTFRQYVNVRCKGTPHMDFAGERSLSNLSLDTGHELTHAALRESVPMEENLQESAAVFMEHSLEGPYDQESNAHIFDYHSIDVVKGAKGLGIPPMTVLEYEGTALQAFRCVVLQEFLRIAGGRDNFLKILKASKKAALRRKPDHEGYISVPSIREWLDIADTVVPSFSRQYKASTLSQPLESDDRVIFGMHKKWGFVFSCSTFHAKATDQANTERRQGLPSYGKLTGNPNTIILYFPRSNPKEKIALSKNGTFIVGPKLITEAFNKHCPDTLLERGEKIIVEIPAMEKTVELEWDEKAEKRLQESAEK